MALSISPVPIPPICKRSIYHTEHRRAALKSAADACRWYVVPVFSEAYVHLAHCEIRVRPLEVAQGLGVSIAPQSRYPPLRLARRTRRLDCKTRAHPNCTLKVPDQFPVWGDWQRHASTPCLYFIRAKEQRARRRRRYEVPAQSRLARTVCARDENSRRRRINRCSRACAHPATGIVRRLSL
jgi:hypothetical protein